jgi:hypothetical protein
MGLRLEANYQSDLDNRHRRVLQQFFSASNPAPQKVLMGPQAGRHPELRGKVHTAQSRGRGQI